jgi:hypothetical protein
MSVDADEKKLLESVEQPLRVRFLRSLPVRVFILLVRALLGRPARRTTAVAWCSRASTHAILRRGHPRRCTWDRTASRTAAGLIGFDRC